MVSSAYAQILSYVSMSLWLTRPVSKLALTYKVKPLCVNTYPRITLPCVRVPVIWECNITHIKSSILIIFCAYIKVFLHGGLFYPKILVPLLWKYSRIYVWRNLIKVF